MPKEPGSEEEIVDFNGLKSPEAFRSISEVAGILQVPQHVLRFWESKFSRLKPLKRRGGRRYYRVSDIELLCGVHKLLYIDRYTIEGVQKVFSLHGARFVAEIGRNILSRSSNGMITAGATEIEEKQGKESPLPHESREWMQSAIPSLMPKEKMDGNDFEITEADRESMLEALDELEEISAAMKLEFEIDSVVEFGEVALKELGSQYTEKEN